ncbi:hypothetical protein Micbo1qcDRAFT_208554 [Microdochium bolleyi]|uniref:LysM domain-containing protein n=1 Tax=Microdochium bolleyi TaxID=196109 RepID=A0A136IQH0_9PEZI|nr:hypothetical protein Micbo1qcDRAFT_208554 [Microdochium bolleyi]
MLTRAPSGKTRWSGGRHSLAPTAALLGPHGATTLGRAAARAASELVMSTKDRAAGLLDAKVLSDVVLLHLQVCRDAFLALEGLANHAEVGLIEELDGVPDPSNDGSALASVYRAANVEAIATAVGVNIEAEVALVAILGGGSAYKGPGDGDYMPSIQSILISAVALLAASTTAQRAPPTQTMPNINRNCQLYYVAQAGDTCEKAWRAGMISADEFFSWNPDVDRSCTRNFWVGYSYCVKA